MPNGVDTQAYTPGTNGDCADSLDLVFTGKMDYRPNVDAALWFAAGADDFWLSAGLWAKIRRLTLVMGAGALAYFAALWLLGFRLADFNRREPL